VVAKGEGYSEETHPWVERLFPMLLLGTTFWLFTTVVWSNTYGPGYGGKHERQVSSEV
jgi:hypothetical protein